MELAGVTLRSGGLPCLDRIDLSVPPGCLLAVLGRGGSGKSALLAVLEGSTRQSTGDLRFAGRPLRYVPPHRRGFGVVRQEEALFPRLTLAQNVAYPLRLRGIPARERGRLVDAALESVLLGGQGHVPARLATAAMRRRAAIARAAVFGPFALLLDEPLAAELPAERPAMVAALRRLHSMLGIPTVLATRVAADALALGDQVAVLHQGRIQQVAAPGSLYENPASAVAAALAGEVNLLPGVVQAVDEDGMARVKLACGPVVEAVAGGGLRERDRCLFALRPERVAVAAVSAAEIGDDALDATVLETLVLGDVLRLRLLLGTGAEVLVKRPAAAGLRGLSAGARVAMAWQPHHGQAFPE